MLQDEDIHKIISEAPTLEKAVGELIDSANAAGGTDNITAMVVECSFTNPTG